MPDRGLDVYSSHPSTEVFMAAYRINKGPRKSLDFTAGDIVPAELREALLDPQVEKIAFNAQFERVITRRVLKIKTPIRGWRCAMALAYLHSFIGGLDEVSAQMKRPLELQKFKDGKRLINLFSKPQRITKNNPHEWRDRITDPDDWQLFREYNVQDIVAEEDIWDMLQRFYMPPDEWEFYEISERINDRGYPIDIPFVSRAIEMSDRRKAELFAEMQEITSLDNPNSRDQLLPWLSARGYPFDDLQKDTISKVLAEHEEGVHYFVYGTELEPECEAVLRLRQNSARMSVTKYNALLNAIGPGNVFRFSYQFAGASRTARFAGRKFQQHNLVRTPKALSVPKSAVKLGVPPDIILDGVTDAIREGDYERLQLYCGAPTGRARKDREALTDTMDMLAGCMRSSIRAEPGEKLVVADLKSIETRVIAWLARCQRLVQIFLDGKDPYIDFATSMFKVAYEEVTSAQRQIAKSPVLGCGYRLGGGELIDGKRTGLWGYAEDNGVDMPKEVWHEAVGVYRRDFNEVVQCWYDLESASVRTTLTGETTTVGFLKFHKKRPFLLMELPSGRNIHYFAPRVHSEERQGKNGPYMKNVFSYMGKEKDGHAWVRIHSHGGKLIENAVQATARDVLKVGMIRAHRAGFNLRLHVHDELGATHRDGDNEFTLERLCGIMSEPIEWAPTLPLGADGYVKQYYRKD